MIKMNKITKIFKPILFYVALGLLVYALTLKINILDFDLWARLINGFSIVNNGHVFYNDIVSYTQTHLWYDPEWLTSSLFYIVLQKFSGQGLVFLRFLLSYLIFIFIMFNIKNSKNETKNKYNLFFYLIILLILIESGAILFTVRCQLITYILLGIWFFILEKTRNNQNKYLIFLPIIMLFWLNLHGGSIAGVGIIILYAIGEFLNKKPYKKYLIILCFICLVYFLNPWGYKFIKFMFQSAYLDRSWIMEWQSPFIVNKILIYKIYLILSFICFLIITYLNNKKRISHDWTKTIILIATGVLSIIHMKHIALFIISSVIFQYRDFMHVYNYLIFKLRLKMQISKKAFKKLILIKEFILYFVVISYSLLIIHFIPLKTSYYKAAISVFPLEAVEFLKINEIKGNIFSLFQYGSFLAYKTYPNIKIFIDGRQEQVYEPELLDASMFLLMGINQKAGYILKKYPPDIILLENKSKIYDYFTADTKWKKIYNDDNFTVFIDKNKDKYIYKNVSKTKYELANEIFNSYFLKGANN